MHCYGCGCIVEPSEASCSHCEAAAPRRCRGCRGLNPAAARHCGSCGRALEPTPQARSARVADSAAPALERQTSRSAIAGERRLVTVLFADLRGSLGVVEQRDPEQVQALLDAVVMRMVDAVERYGGTVNQVMGDGIMALFGAPQAQEDHAVRAANAALQMQESVGRMDDASWAALGLTPEIRVGLDSGEVLVRTARTELGLEYRAVGATTHMAARMEQLAGPGAVLLTEHTFRLGRGMLRARSLGSQLVKGSNEPVEVFELTGLTAQTRFQANLALGISPLVGREEPLRTLWGGLSGMLAGRAGAVVVSGEPGVGKSRLCYEALQAHGGTPIRVVEACSMSYARSRPHGLLSNLLRSIIEVDAADAPQLVRKRLQDTARRLDVVETVEARDAELRALLDLPIDDARWRRLDPSQRRRRIEQTLRVLLDALCADGPTVLFFEDLHWSDDDSLAFVSALVERPPGERTLVLLTHRPELSTRWSSLPHVHTCRLEPLDAAASEELLRALLGESELAPPARRVLAQTHGNPFFIEESARALLAAGIDLCVDARERIEMPATVEALLAARVDRLAPEHVELLQAAAVQGDDTPAEVLQRVVGVRGADFDERIAALTRADLLYETRAVRASRYNFRHALIQDVVYNRLPKHRLRDLHRASADALEALYPDRLAEHVERLAEHTFRAEDWARSLGYHETASLRALRSSASAAAWRHLERCLLLVEKLPEGRARSERAIDLRLRAMAPLVPLGEHERTLQLLEEAERRCEALGDPARMASIHSQQSMTLWLLAENRRAQPVARQALEEAVAVGAEATELATRYYQAVIHHALGELDEAMGALRALYPVLDGPMARNRMGWAGYPSCFIATFAGAALALQGGFEEGLAILEKGRLLGEELDHPYSRTMVLEEYGFMQLLMGEPGRALETLELAMRLCVDNEVHVMHAPIAARLGRALIETGDATRGRRVIEDALERETYRAAAHYGIDYLLVAHAQALLHDGELEEALASAQRAEDEAASHDEQAYHVCGMLAHAEVLAHGDGDWQRRAFDRYAATLQRARELGMRPYEALVRQGMAALHARRGEDERACVEREAAIALWRQLGAPARVEQLLQARTPTSKTARRSLH